MAQSAARLLRRSGMVAAVVSCSVLSHAGNAQVVPAPLPSSAELAGVFRWQHGGFTAPVACAISTQGVVTVADAGGALVGLNAATGEERWSCSLIDGAPMLEPAGVAALSDGSFVFTDARRRRIDRVSADGAWVGRVGEALEIREPSAIAASATRLAILDRATGDILLCNLDATEPTRISAGSIVTPEGRRLVSSGLAFVDDGRLALVAAAQNTVALIALGPGTAPRIERVFGGRGPFPGFFNHPQGIAAAGGWLFVADEFNHRISRYAFDGTGQLAYGQHAVLPRAGEGAVHYPVGIAVAIASLGGSAPEPLAVACEPFERRVQAFAPSLAPEPADMRLVLPKLEGIQSHFGAAAARSGQRLFLHDPESCSVIVFDLSKGQPVHVSTLGAAGAKPHEFGRIDALLALDEGRRLLVADSGNRRLALWELTPPPKDLIFEPFMGKLVKTRPYERLPLAPVSELSSLALDTDGSILALDADGPALIKLDRSLRGGSREELAVPDTTARAVAIARSDAGTLGLLLDRPPALATFTRADGATAWTPAGMSALAPCVRARSLIADGAGGWVVVDDWGDRIIRVSRDGTQVASGARGVADGELWLPSAVAPGESGGIYLVDSGNHRGQRFDRAGKWEMTFSLGRTYTRARTTDEVMRVRKRPTATTPTPSPAPSPSAPGHSSQPGGSS